MIEGGEIMELTNKREIINDLFNFKNEALKDQLEDLMSFRIFKYGDNIITAGEYQENIYFNLKGIFRGYYIDDNNHEITEFFGTKHGALLKSWNPINEKSIISIQAISRLTTIEFPTDQINRLAQEYPEICAFYNQWLMEVLNWNWKLKKIHFKLSGIEKYQWFLKEFPDLEYYARAKDIASFLQISAVSLSRIKKLMEENES